MIPILAAAAVLLMGAASMPAAAASPGQPPACAAEARQVDVLGEREQALAVYRELPRECLQAVFLSCAAQAREELLDLGSAATCSVSYEALLHRDFGGNFRALIAWWRTTQPPTASQ